METSELKKILDSHKIWIESKGQQGTRANLSGTKLSGANLSGAVLEYADLSNANLVLADLSGAKLSGTKLSGAKLTCANLVGADLFGANLVGADLFGANLSDAYLLCADLSSTNLSKTNISSKNLSNANLIGANLEGANFGNIVADIKPIKDIDAMILALVLAEKKQELYIPEIVIRLAGKPGYDLEKKVGSTTAGSIIYAISSPNKPVPNWYDSNEKAMQDLMEAAKEEI